MLSSARQVQLLVGILFIVGLGAVAYKHLALGFPLLASQKETVWQLEGRIAFEAGDGPVDVRLNLPDDNVARRILSSDNIAPGFEYEEITENGVALGRWRTQHAVGSQVIYTRSQSYFADVSKEALSPLDTPMRLSMDEALKATATAFLQDFTEAPINESNALTVLRALNRPGDELVELLLRNNSSPQKRTHLAGQLLTMLGYSVQPVRGVFLDDKARSQSIYNFLEVLVGDQKVLMDARENAVIPWDRVILLQKGSEPLLEVFGGTNSRITFATTKIQRAAFTSAIAAAGHEQNPLIDFSIYSLPLSEQNIFKLLLVMPLGALVVVILRNLVGIRTSGTFMPVLIALTFLQTTLVTGLMLFVIVVGVGLIMRSYLSSLNLLLVPRIASVLVFVILLYAAIGVLSVKMGWQGGLKVTYFPMIILSWTIERMSVLWDESSGRDVMIECSGSLLTASLAFLLMSNPYVSDTIFLYPELLLVLLGVIIAIGTYTGYRLSDLRRFAPLERY